MTLAFPYFYLEWNMTDMKVNEFKDFEATNKNKITSFFCLMELNLLQFS